MAIDWQDVREDYEHGGVSFKGLGCRYGCSPETVRRRAAKERWVANTPPANGCGVSAPGGEDLSCETVPDSAGRPGSAEKADDHVGLWLEVKRRLARALEHEDATRCLEELKAAKMAGEVLSTVVKGNKEAKEHSECGPADIYEEAEDIVREMERVTIPPRPGEALERE